MGKYSIGVIAVCISVLVTPVHAAGTAAASFLRLVIDARNVAMGETGAAFADLSAANNNPAGLHHVGQNGLTFTHAAWLADTSFQNITYTQKLSDAGIAVSGTYLGISSIDKYDNTGLKTGGSFAPRDMAVKVLYGRGIGTISAGAAIKYISSSLDDVSAQSVAADLGVMVAPRQSETVLIGVLLENIGTPMKFDKESFSLPVNVRAGVRYQPQGNATLAFDLNQALDEDVIAHVGGEYIFRFARTGALAARAGYKTNTKGYDGLTGLTAGLGFGMGGIGIDYAFVPYGTFDTTHRVSLAYRF